MLQWLVHAAADQCWMAEHYTVSVSLVEIAGKHCVDLLGPTRTQLRLCEDSKGVIRLLDNVWSTVTSAAEMQSVLNDAKSQLAVHATQVAMTNRSMEWLSDH